MKEITLERNATCKKALDDWANADLTSKQTNCAIGLSVIVQEIGILAIVEKGRTGSEGLNLNGNINKQIQDGHAKRHNTVSRTMVSRVWNEHLATLFEMGDGVLLYDPKDVATMVQEFQSGERRLKPKAPTPKGNGSSSRDPVFGFINDIAKPMTKAKAVKTVKRIMGACGLTVADLK